MKEDAEHFTGQTILDSPSDSMLFPGKQYGAARLVRKAFLTCLFVGVLYLIFTSGSRKKIARMKRVTYSPEPIRSNAEGLLEIGQSCMAGGRKDVVHNRHAIVLDAGSTGSRVHVYEFQCCGDNLVMLADEVFEEVKPGLSSYNDNPMEAGKSLAPLIARALKRVPEFLHSCTPLVLKATAGLRLLPQRVVEEILDAVKGWLQTHPFLLGPHHDEQLAPVAVMDGSEEAVYAWVTVNFLKKQIGHLSDIDLSATSIVMDLGGGSTQIVFAIPDPKRGAAVNPLDYPEFYYQLQFHGHTHHLYQHSYLGFGLMEARKAIKELFLKIRHTPQHGLACFPDDYAESVDGREIFGDGGGFDRCYSIVRAIFNTEAECKVKPCSFNGIHQPPLPKWNGKQPNIVVFSYFYDRLIPLGLTSPMTLKQIEAATRRICGTSRHGESHDSHLLVKNPQWCLDATYIYTLLSVGYKIGPDTPITVTKQIEGYEAGWALGTALKLLELHPNTCPLPNPLIEH